MEAMFGSQNTYGFGNMGSPFNAFFPSNSDPFWGSNTKASRTAGLAGPPGAPYRMHETADTYNYHHDNYAPASALGDSAGMKHVESGITGEL